MQVLETRGGGVRLDIRGYTGGVTGVRVDTHPFKAGDLHGLHRGRVDQDGGPQFKHVSDELVALETRASER